MCRIWFCGLSISVHTPVTFSGITYYSLPVTHQNAKRLGLQHFQIPGMAASSGPPDGAGAVAYKAAHCSYRTGHFCYQGRGQVPPIFGLLFLRTGWCVSSRSAENQGLPLNTVLYSLSWEWEITFNEDLFDLGNEAVPLSNHSPTYALKMRKLKLNF